ncbi:D-xylose reductase [Savitreella phatthalungensis]
MTATLQLNDGGAMPTVGFGLWKIPQDVCADQVYNAIKTGYRLLDGACDYGNEKQVGQGIKRAIDEGIVKRSDLFVTTKLWNTYHAKENVRPAFERSLNDMGLEYIDLYLIHFPISLAYVPFDKRYPPGFFFDDAGKEVRTEKSPMHETWAAMEELVQSGQAKHIGISNFNAQLIMDLLRYAKIQPAVLQIEHHPYYVQQDLIDYCEEQKIKVTAYSSFGPTSYVELDTIYSKDTPPLLEHDLIKQIADKHGKTTGQVLLRWATQRGVAVIPKSNNPQRLQANLECTEFDLTQDDLKQLSGLDQDRKFNAPEQYGIPLRGLFA